MKPVSTQNENESVTGSANGTSKRTFSPKGAASQRTAAQDAPQKKQTPPPPAPPSKLADYTDIIGAAEIEELKTLASKIKGKTVKMVNSTALGGGVAEMLNQLVPLMNELEVKTGWDVIKGEKDFFEVTKNFHNALQGGEYKLTEQARETFLKYNQENSERLHFPEDVVVIHDPQPAALIRAREKSHGRWVWRCHIDLSKPNAEVWNFLRPFVEQYDASIFSSQAFTQDLSITQYLFYPCIDPLSEKNKRLDESYIQKVCDQYGVDRSRPIVTQVSRFDRAKDPVGVVQAFKKARKSVDCQLVLAGGGAADDPEGAAVLKDVKEAAGNDRDIIILDLPPWSALEINALQRASTLIVQKSVKEGFGLTVTEALWKEKPTIAGAVGGIPNQIINKLTGMLVHSVDECAEQIQYLLEHPDFAKELGRNGCEHVKANFLITTDLRRWLLLVRILLGIG